jgi:hypothetical protein
VRSFTDAKRSAGIPVVCRSGELSELSEIFLLDDQTKYLEEAMQIKGLRKDQRGSKTSATVLRTGSISLP